ITFNARLNLGQDDPALHVPQWVFDAGATKVYSAPTVGYTTLPMIEIPEYWNATYKAKYADFVDDLANYIETRPALRDNIEYVQIGVGKYGETQPADEVDHDNVAAAMVADGLSEANWPDVVNAITQMYVNAFDTVRLLLPMAPRLGSEINRRTFTDYAIHSGVGLFPAGLTADQEWCDLRTKAGFNGAGKYDRILDQAETGHPLVTEPAVPAVPVSFEMYEYMTGTPVEFFWGAAAALSRRVDYITVERTALYYGTDPNNPITGNIAIMRWASPYMGAHISSSSPAKAPSVFVALRETGMISASFAQRGNYSFGLKQDDSVSGGATVAVSYRTDEQLVSAGIRRDYPSNWSIWVNTAIENIADDATLADLKNPNASPDPDEPVDTYPSRKGWIARRTNQATGNRYMYFKVDDAYLYGGSNEVTITVHYFDRGTDQWRLEYDGVSNNYQVAGTVTKTNSKQWKVAKFTLTDAEFANGQSGGSDFRIDCLSDGNEYLHMVDVKPGPGGALNYQVALTTQNGGWNFVSAPLAPTSSDPATYLSSIAGKYDIVQAFQGNAWLSHPGGGLTSINERTGMWIHVTQNCTLNVSGTAPASTTIPLAVGWNMVGWPTTTSRPVTTALAGIAGKYSVVYSYDATDTADPWKLYSPTAPTWVNDLVNMQPGRGYWIYVTTATNLEVPW
ncbi:MAG: hypothetical protein GX557_03670, partial [Chloroflexi bacterium]|nr:hypothetical protein [Chloroflexota bacterium]